MDVNTTSWELSDYSAYLRESQSLEGIYQVLSKARDGVDISVLLLDGNASTVAEHLIPLAASQGLSSTENSNLQLMRVVSLWRGSEMCPEAYQCFINEIEKFLVDDGELKLPDLHSILDDEQVKAIISSLYWFDGALSSPYLLRQAVLGEIHAKNVANCLRLVYDDAEHAGDFYNKLSSELKYIAATESLNTSECARKLLWALQKNDDLHYSKSLGDGFDQFADLVATLCAHANKDFDLIESVLTLWTTLLVKRISRAMSPQSYEAIRSVKESMGDDFWFEEIELSQTYSPIRSIVMDAIYLLARSDRFSSEMREIHSWFYEQPEDASQRLSSYLRSQSDIKPNVLHKWLGGVELRQVEHEC